MTIKRNSRRGIVLSKVGSRKSKKTGAIPSPSRECLCSKGRRYKGLGELSGQFKDAKNQDGLGNRLGEKRLGAPETEKVQFLSCLRTPIPLHLQGSVSDSITNWKIWKLWSPNARTPTNLPQ